MMDRFTHYLVVFCQIGSVIIGLTLLGAVIVWTIGFVGATVTGVVLVTVFAALLLAVVAAQDGA